MPRTLVVLLSIVVGIATGEAIYRSEICRDIIGRLCGRGRLIAPVDGRGIYEADAKREMMADQYLAGNKPPVTSKETVLNRLIANEKLRQVCHNSPAFGSDVAREFNLLRHQFADDRSWQKRLHESGFSRRKLQAAIRENICGRNWIEHSLAEQSGVEDQEIRAYYAQHLVLFAQPLRFRASHIFLAAPAATPSDVVKAKQKLIESLATRLRGGEDFEALVWEESEDEATKPRGGDLGYFSQSRMPPDFFAFVSQMKIGEAPKMFRSALGFHIVRLIEIKLARQMLFEEARPEILAALRNAKRQRAVEMLATKLSGTSTLRMGWFWN